MTSPGGVEAGRAAVRVVPNTSKFFRDLKRSLDRIEATTFLKLPVKFDFKTAEFRAALDRLERNKIEIPVSANTGRLTNSVKATIRAVQAYATTHPIDLRVDIDVDQAALQARINAAANTANAKVKLTMDNSSIAGIRSQARILRGYLVATFANIQIDIHASTDRVMASVRATIGQAQAYALTHPIDLRVDLDVNRTRIQAQINSISGGRVGIKLNIDNSSIAAVRAQARVLKAYLVAMFHSIPVRFELSNVASLLAQMISIRGIIAGLGSGGGGGAGSLLGSAGGMAGSWQQLAVAIALVAAALPFVISAISVLSAVIASLLGSILTTIPAIYLLVPALLGLVGVAAAVIIGVQGIGDALSAAASGDAEEFNKAMKKLTPSAQAFVRTVISLKPAWERVSKAVQEALFTHLGTGLKNAADNLLPAVQKGLVGLAHSASVAGNSILNTLSKPAMKVELSQTVGKLSSAFDRLATLAGPIVETFLRVSNVLSGPLGWAFQVVTNHVNSFLGQINRMTENNELQSWVEYALFRLSDLWQIIKNVGNILGSIAQGARDAKVSFQPLIDITKQWASYLASPEGQAKIKKFFADAQSGFQKLAPTITAVGTLLGVLWDAFVALSPMISDFITNSLVPLINTFADVMEKIRPFLPMIGVALLVAVTVVTLAFAAFLTILGFVAAVILGPIMAAIAILVGAIAGVVWVVQNWGTIWENVSNWILSVWESMGNGIIAAWNWIWSVLQGAAAQVWGWGEGIGNAVKSMTTAVANFLGNMTRAAAQKVAEFRNAITQGVQNAVNSVRNFAGAMVQAGINLVRGLADGIRNGISSVISAAADVASAAISAAKSVLGINSPSRVFRQIGAWTVDGFVDELHRSKSLVASASNALMDAAVPSSQFLGGEFAGSALVNHRVSMEKTPITLVVDGQDMGAMINNKISSRLKQSTQRYSVYGGQ